MWARWRGERDSTRTIKRLGWGRARNSLSSCFPMCGMGGVVGGGNYFYFYFYFILFYFILSSIYFTLSLSFPSWPWNKVIGCGSPHPPPPPLPPPPPVEASQAPFVGESSRMRLDSFLVTSPGEGGRGGRGRASPAAAIHHYYIPYTVEPVFGVTLCSLVWEYNYFGIQNQVK